MDDSHYEVQKVQIRNNIPLEEAKSKYKRITKRNAKKVRETKNFYQFRLQPPTRFIKGSFRAKKVNKDVILIVAELKPEFQHLSGGGFGDFFKRAYNSVSGAVSSVGNKIVNAFTIHDYSTKTKRNLELYGDLPVVALEIRRKPLNIAIELAFQGVSAGQWEQLKKKYGFDKFYHLSAVVTLKKEDTKQMAFEKLEVVSFNDNIGYKEGDGTEVLPVEVPKPFTVADMFNKTRKTVGDDRFFSYSGVGGNNCQDFIAMCLTSVGLYGAKEKAFTYQDMKALTDELPLKVKAVARGVTQIGAIANKFLGIGGSHEFFDEEYENEIPHSLNSIVGGMNGANDYMDFIDEVNGFYSDLQSYGIIEPEDEDDVQPNPPYRRLDERAYNLIRRSRRLMTGATPDRVSTLQRIARNIQSLRGRLHIRRNPEELKGNEEASALLRNVLPPALVDEVGSYSEHFPERIRRMNEAKEEKEEKEKEKKGSSKPDSEQFLNYVKEHKHDLEGKHTVEQMFIDFKEKLAFDKQQIKNAKRIQKIQDKMKEPSPKEQEKALKEKEKADKKAEKEREKEYKKSLKEQEKAHKKAEKKGTKMEEREEREADDTLYPWTFKGKTYLKNIYDEVYLRGYKGGVGEWVGVFDGEKIDDTIPEPEYDEPAVPEPETDPALDKKSKIEPEKPSKYLTRNTWLDAKGKKVKFMYNGKKETGTLLFWNHPKLVQRVPGPLGVRGAYDEFISAMIRLPTDNNLFDNFPITVPVFEGLKNVAKMKLV